MSLSDRSRRAATVGLGSLLLVLAAGPAFGAVPSPDLAGSAALPAGSGQVAQDALAPAAEVLAPVAPTASVDAAAAALTSSAPAAVSTPTSSPAPVAPAPVEAVTAVVDALVKVVLDQVDQKPVPATDPAPAPGLLAEDPVTGQGSTGRTAEAPAPSGNQLPGVSAAVAEANTAVEAIADAAVFGSLASLARDAAAGAAADSLLPGLPGTASGPALAVSELMPRGAASPEFLSAGSTDSGPVGLPTLLVALAVAAVVVSAAGHAAEIRRRQYS